MSSNPDLKNSACWSLERPFICYSKNLHYYYCDCPSERKEIHLPQKNDIKFISDGIFPLKKSIKNCLYFPSVAALQLIPSVAYDNQAMPPPSPASRVSARPWLRHQWKRTLRGGFRENDNQQATTNQQPTTLIKNNNNQSKNTNKRTNQRTNKRKSKETNKERKKERNKQTNKNQQEQEQKRKEEKASLDFELFEN